MDYKPKLSKHEQEQLAEKVRFISTDQYDYAITEKHGIYCLDKKSKKGKRYYFLVGSEVWADKPYESYAKQRVSMGECSIYFEAQNGR